MPSDDTLSLSMFGAGLVVFLIALVGFAVVGTPITEAAGASFDLGFGAAAIVGVIGMLIAIARLVYAVLKAGWRLPDRPKT